MRAVCDACDGQRMAYGPTYSDKVPKRCFILGGDVRVVRKKF